MTKKIFDGFFAILITSAFVCCLPSCRNQSANKLQSRSPINIIVNGKAATFEKGFPYINENGKTLAPLDLFNRYLGASVNLNKEKAFISKDKFIIELQIGKRQAMINGGELDMPCRVIIEDGVVMVPVRAVAEALGATVGWDAATRSVSVDTNGAKTH
jgi:hypothetical protein